MRAQENAVIRETAPADRDKRSGSSEREDTEKKKKISIKGKMDERKKGEYLVRARCHAGRSGRREILLLSAAATAAAATTGEETRRRPLCAHLNKYEYNAEKKTNKKYK